MKKSLLIVLIIILLVGIVSFVVFYLVVNKNDNPVSIPEIWSNFLKNEKCESAINITSIISSGDLKKCSCLINPEQINKCQTSVTDANLYTRALKEFDSSLCNSISVLGMKDACIRNVSAKTAFAQKNSTDSLYVSYLETGNYSELIKILENYLITEPTNVSYLINLARAYAEKGLAEHSENEYVIKALTLTGKAKTIEPNNSEIYLVEGFIHETNMDLQKSITSYDQAIRLSNNISAYIGRGHVKEVFGDIRGAIKDYDDAKALDPKNEYISIYSNLCRVYLYYGLPDLALKECQIVVSSDLSADHLKSEAYQIIGTIYSNLKEYDKAWEQFKLAEISNPNDVNLSIIIAEMLISKQDYIKAEEYARKAISIDSKKSIAYEKLAMALLKQNKYKEAVDIGLKALSLIEKDPSVLFIYKIAVKERVYAILSQAYAGLGDIINKDKYSNLSASLYNK